MNVASGLGFHKKSVDVWQSGVESQVGEEVAQGSDGHLGGGHLHVLQLLVHQLHLHRSSRQKWLLHRSFCPLCACVA